MHIEAQWLLLLLLWMPAMLFSIITVAITVHNLNLPHPRGLCREQYTFSEIIKTTFQKLAVTFQSIDAVTSRIPNHELKQVVQSATVAFCLGFFCDKEKTPGGL